MSTKVPVSPSAQSRHYRIRVEGKIDPSWSGWFSGMKVVCARSAGPRPVTILTGPVHDQAALRGLLGRIWDLNLVVLEVRQLNPQVRMPRQKG